MSKPPVVIDNGTGYTKMGYAGNYEPSFMVPSFISNAIEKVGQKANPVQDLDFLSAPKRPRSALGTILTTLSVTVLLRTGTTWSAIGSDAYTNISHATLKSTSCF